MEPPAYDPRFLAGVKYFNECEFFEAHDAWEELWQDYQGPSRLFYKGLIHAAVCLHHFGNENARGAIKLYHSCRKYLDGYRPHHEGVDVDKLLAEMERCCAELVNSEEEFPRVQIVPDLIPEIHLDPPPASPE